MQDEEIDWKDVAIYASYGPLLSNLGHTWYRHLHVFTNRTLRMTTWQMVSTKLAADAFVFGPLHVTALLTWTHFWQRKPLNVRTRYLRLDVLRRILYQLHPSKLPCDTLRPADHMLCYTVFVVRCLLCTMHLQLITAGQL